MAKKSSTKLPHLGKLGSKKYGLLATVALFVIVGSFFLIRSYAYSFDFNGDGRSCTTVDVNIIGLNYNRSGGYRQGDVNGDGWVGYGDRMIFKKYCGF